MPENIQEAAHMTFLSEPAPSEAQQKMYDADVDEDGYVWDNSKVWAHQPALNEQLGDLIAAAADAAGLSRREKAMLVIGQASTIGDSYCSFAWGRWMTEWEDAPTAIAALRGDDEPFDERERALAQWARTVARDPNGATPADIQRLRDVGFDDPQILALTLYAALRLALSTTNDALGARPDLALAEMLDPAIRATITWGRQPA
jgi:alkylhydroperoxidase family enzyme